jgi:GxxExxY protein
VTENELSGEIIGAAIEVHRVLGPGLLESIYEEAFAMELQDRNIRVSRRIEVPAMYKGRRLQNSLRLDLLVADLIVVEVKSVERILPVHEAQLLSYLRLAQKKLGLLINFNSTVLSKSVRRIVNQL